MIDKLILQSGADVAFNEGRLMIHPPSLYEIGLIGGEVVLWEACDIITTTKKDLIDVDKSVLDEISNFDIIMSMVKDKNIKTRQKMISVFKLFSLLFPNREVKIEDKQIIFTSTQGQIDGFLDANNFDLFQKIITDIFDLNKIRGKKDYNPVNDAAAKIAEKLKKASMRKAKQQSKNNVTIFDRYISILAVGEHKNQTDLVKLTIYQLYDEYERFMLNQNYDYNIRWRMAGATDMETPSDWRSDIHTDES